MDQKQQDIVKRPYARPVLTTFGTVASLTQQVGLYFNADGGTAIGKTRSSTVACRNGQGQCP